MNLRDKIELIRSDITTIEVDIIVNAANTSLLGGGGVDGAIHRKGGKEILNDCRKIIARQGGCKVGQAVITTAGKLPAKYVVHTVGPVWNGGNKNEDKLLQECYLQSLQLAIDNNCKTIAFPNISTGIYKFPKDKAALISVNSVVDFLSKTDEIEKVIFVCFDEDNYYWIQRVLNHKVFTIPSKLFAEDELLGNVDIGLADDGMGILSGHLIPNETYMEFRQFLRDTLMEDQEDSLIRINEFTKEKGFKVIAEDGTEFKDPVAGLIIYDFEEEPIELELNGIDRRIWTKYFD